MQLPATWSAAAVGYAEDVVKHAELYAERALEIGQRIGMIVLFSLMAFAIYNDIYRLVGG